MAIKKTVGLGLVEACPMSLILTVEAAYLRRYEERYLKITDNHINKVRYFQ